MTEFEKMKSGLVFDGGDPEIDAIRNQTQKYLQQFNQSTETKEKLSILPNVFNAFGQSFIQAPFFCEFGKTISIGNETFINMNVTMLDGAEITIGNNVLIGPNAQFYTASHSLDYKSRRCWETYCKPIVIEDDVWVGGSVVINQGVTIGARSVIAANSVVNHDVPSDCLYGGTPAKLIKRLDQK
ncbi:sugar O-acetyltransferase [Aliivibrio fischeri]|uniref:Nodulation protein L n=2 Tax=Aliivibrio fischeri TaxID=668 RepID=Q5DZ11_ALIF1|nr:sugar O-acetyltransferase [Aliivibrio fischeri]AAW87985.1 acetyltransferase [Aliivibrio fischeri ES114]KLU80471.1 acetyltransferase [Aliivibrio fischeri]MBP3139853.1 sugar O-acetyltransferase [Aliivibrio fischeri]MBP3154235.1 sugar O-acetyltransferase [Aliivibrio fischeri]MCE7536141.1 sugar O-acetyltransferase [Aliivibrio fischeri]